MSNQKNNSGVLFKNNKTKEGQPDYTGTMIVGNEDYRISAWVNKSKSGQSYFRLLFSEVVPQPVNVPAHQQALPVQSGTDNNESVDDLPF